MGPHLIEGQKSHLAGLATRGGEVPGIVLVFDRVAGWILIAPPVLGRHRVFLSHRPGRVFGAKEMNHRPPGSVLRRQGLLGGGHFNGVVTVQQIRPFHRPLRLQHIVDHDDVWPEHQHMPPEFLEARVSRLAAAPIGVGSVAHRVAELLTGEEVLDPTVGLGAIRLPLPTHQDSIVAAGVLVVLQPVRGSHRDLIPGVVEESISAVDQVETVVVRQHVAEGAEGAGPQGEKQVVTGRFAKVLRVHRDQPHVSEGPGLGQSLGRLGRRRWEIIEVFQPRPLEHGGVRQAQRSLVVQDVMLPPVVLIVRREVGRDGSNSIAIPGRMRTRNDPAERISIGQVVAPRLWQIMGVV